MSPGPQVTAVSRSCLQHQLHLATMANPGASGFLFLVQRERERSKRSPPMGSGPSLPSDRPHLGPLPIPGVLITIIREMVGADWFNLSTPFPGVGEELGFPLL